MRIDDKNRCFAKYPDLKESIDKLKYLNCQDRNKIIHGMKDLILHHDNELFDKYVIEFPFEYGRRWYDKDPYSWLVINSLKYADENLKADIIIYLHEKLKSHTLVRSLHQ
jgi:hypothetical protein